VAALIDLARALRLQAVAEGVETEAERAWLQARSCELLQGNLVCPPLAAEACGSFLHRQAGSGAGRQG